MLRAVPKTIWTYIGFDLWRLLLLTAAVLVTILAFAAAVKFLADGKLGPLDTVRFMLFAIPPMLQYALPFAAGFAATLAYHRFAAENEALAAHAGGISHRRLLIPAVLSGLLLATLLAVLNNRTIPMFLRAMQDMVTQDVTRLVVSSIERGEAVPIGDKFLRADTVERLRPNPASGAYQELLLTGVLVVQFDEATGEVNEAAAPRAFVWFFRDAVIGDDSSAGDPGSSGGGGGEAGRTLVVLQLPQVVGQWDGVRIEGEDKVFQFAVPDVARDDPKFLTWSELRETRDRPEMLAQVEQRRRKLAYHLAEREAMSQVRETLGADGGVRLSDAEGREIRLLAGGLGEYDPGRRAWPLSARGGARPIELERRLTGGEVVREIAEAGWVSSRVRPEELNGEPTLQVRLERVRPVSASADRTPASAIWAERELRGLTLVGSPAAEFMAMPSWDLLREADTFAQTHGADTQVLAARDELRRRIGVLIREADSKAQERIAMCVACLVMVVTGSVLALRLRESLPLVVYLWSFFPALATVLTIVGGQQMMEQHGGLGVPVLWGGVVGLTVYTGVEFFKLRRH